MTIDKKFIRYGIVGTLGTLIHLTLLVVLVEALNFQPLIGSSLAFIAVVIVSYYLNYNWTFKAKNNHVAASMRYLAVCLMGFGLNAGIMFVVVDVWQLWYLLGQIISVILIPISNFILNYYWAFKSE